jgi:hypothetical protein
LDSLERLTIGFTADQPAAEATPKTEDELAADAIMSDVSGTVPTGNKVALVIEDMHEKPTKDQPLLLASLPEGIQDPNDDRFAFDVKMRPEEVDVKSEKWDQVLIAETPSLGGSKFRWARGTGSGEGSAGTPKLGIGKKDEDKKHPLHVHPFRASDSRPHDRNKMGSSAAQALELLVVSSLYAAVVGFGVLSDDQIYVGFNGGELWRPFPKLRGPHAVSWPLLGLPVFDALTCSCLSNPTARSPTATSRAF